MQEVRMNLNMLHAVKERGMWQWRVIRVDGIGIHGMGMERKGEWRCGY